MDQLFEGAVFAEDFDDQEQVDSLRGALTYSQAVGRLFVAADDGTIRSADIRQHLLSGEWEKGPGGDRFKGTSDTLPIKTILPRPQLDLNIAKFSLSRSGTFAAVAGPTLADPELTAAYVLDVTARRPVAHGNKDDPGAQAMCDAVPFDPFLFSTRPGLRVLQLSWHPDSERHLAVLTSDATLRLYDMQRPDFAEQTFELRGEQRRRLELDDYSPAVEKPAAFAFGTRGGWDRFTIYFTSTTGRVYSLCPMAPFGCQYPAKVVESLQETVEGGGLGPEGENADVWLQRAFQVMPPVSPEKQPVRLASSVPHALDEHVPLMVGPLPVCTASGDVEYHSPAHIAGRDGGQFQDIALWRYGDNCTAVATASSEGVVGLHLLLGAVSPQWCESKPQCVVHDGRLSAVRSQITTSSSSSDTVCIGIKGGFQELVLMDVVTVGPAMSHQPSPTSSDDLEYSLGTRVSLRPDLSAPETLYCVHPTGVTAIALSWLPVLADALATGAPGSIPSTLPGVIVDTVGPATSPSNHGVVDAVPVGDALCGSAVVVLYGDGSHRCVRPDQEVALDSTNTSRQGGKEGAAADNIEKQIKQTYSHLLKGPKKPALPPSPSSKVGADSIEGRKMLTEAVAALRSSHVEYIHQAHHELQQRMVRLQSDLEEQKHQTEKLALLAESAAEGAEALGALLARVLALQTNLSSRLHLLAELHWALPRPASEAEARFKSQELPGLELAASQVADEVKMLCGRVESLQRQIKPLAIAQHELSAVPLQQLRKVRQVLIEHEAAIKTLQEQTTLCEEAACGRVFALPSTPTTAMS